ncbi:MAG TPA: MucB/RseB C-terminal domain-containing protein [Paucimonas sp.]|nr:MucB/RseB C-terminal domain-containing protein [Paucimonas sp.]
MRQALISFRFVVVVFSFIAVQAQAQNTEPQADKRDAQGWLRTLQSAAQKLSYSGTFIYQQGSQVRTSRITHVVDGRNELEKLEILDGKPREYIRSNEEIVYYIPELRTLLVEKRVAQDVFPGILAANPGDLATYYTMRKAETGRVAGFDCQAIVLEPKDRLRYGYKLWAEKNSGLLLRAQTLDDGNDVVEQIAFTQIAIGNIDRGRAKPTFVNTNGWRVENPTTTLSAPSGWNVKTLPPGFKKIGEVKRVVSDTSTTGASANAQAGRREATQLVFSDGLAAISVFIEPGAHSKTEGSMRQGAMNIVGKRHGDFWLTIVGEVPLAAIKQVANSIEFKSK